MEKETEGWREKNGTARKGTRERRRYVEKEEKRKG